MLRDLTLAQVLENICAVVIFVFAVVLALYFLLRVVASDIEKVHARWRARRLGRGKARSG